MRGPEAPGTGATTALPPPEDPRSDGRLCEALRNKAGGKSIVLGPESGRQAAVPGRSRERSPRVAAGPAVPAAHPPGAPVLMGN